MPRVNYWHMRLSSPSLRHLNATALSRPCGPSAHNVVVEVQLMCTQQTWTVGGWPSTCIWLCILCERSVNAVHGHEQEFSWYIQRIGLRDHDDQGEYRDIGQFTHTWQAVGKWSEDTRNEWFVSYLVDPRSRIVIHLPRIHQSVPPIIHVQPK